MKKDNSKKLFVICVALLLSILAACSSNDTETDAKAKYAADDLSKIFDNIRLDSSPSYNEQMDALENSKQAIRVNLTTNRTTIYKDGAPVDQWNIATADVTGSSHGGRKQVTPTGIFTAHRLVYCPSWYPRNPKWPSTGKVAANETERWQIFKKYPNVYGACGRNNPLGKYVLWIKGPYGIHGNSNESVLRRSIKRRRVSGGCVRNPNMKIKELFHSVLLNQGLSSFRSKVLNEESKSNGSRKTTEIYPGDMDLRIVVGRWESDPDLGLGSGSDPVPTPKPTPAPTKVNTTEEEISFSNNYYSLNLSLRTERAYRATDVILLHGYVQGNSSRVRIQLFDGDKLLTSTGTRISGGQFTLGFRAGTLPPKTYNNLEIVVIDSNSKDVLLSGTIDQIKVISF